MSRIYLIKLSVNGSTFQSFSEVTCSDRFKYDMTCLSAALAPDFMLRRAELIENESSSTAASYTNCASLLSSRFLASVMYCRSGLGSGGSAENPLTTSAVCS